MSSLKSSLHAALIASLVTVGGLAFVSHRRELEAGGLRYANGQLRYQANLRRPSRASAVTPTTQDVAVETAENGSPLRNTGAAAAGDYRNEGQATPLAALQTFAWACDRGDTVTVLKMLCFDAAGRTKSEAYMASLPPGARASWNSPEEMAAELLVSANMNLPFPAAPILARASIEPISADRVRLRLSGTMKDRTEYQKTDTGWKYVITEAAVDAYLAHQAKADQAGHQ